MKNNNDYFNNNNKNNESKNEILNDGCKILSGGIKCLISLKFLRLNLL